VCPTWDSLWPPFLRTSITTMHISLFKYEWAVTEIPGTPALLVRDTSDIRRSIILSFRLFGNSFVMALVAYKSFTLVGIKLEITITRTKN
jgi:hypothetical protein